MRIIFALKAFYYALLKPNRIQSTPTSAATAVFAVAVLLVTASETVIAYLDIADTSHSYETVMLMIHGVKEGDNNQSIALLNEKPQFTVIMGGILLKTFISYLVLAALALGVARFLTDMQYSVPIAIMCVSAASSIDILRLLIETPLHAILHSMRYGLHLGVFVDPLQSPLLFSWLQRFDVFSVWYYIAVAIGLTSWEGLDRKYGIVLGLVLFTIVQLVFGALTLLASFISQLG